MAQTTDTLIHPRMLPRIDDAPSVAWTGPTTAGAAHGPITLTLHRDMAAAEQEWRAFEQIADCTPFQTFAWLSAWMQHVGVARGVKPAIVIGRRDGEIAFLLPLAIERSALAHRLTFLGQDLCDYNAPLLAPGFAGAFTGDAITALWRDIRALLSADSQLRHDIIELTKMPDMVGAQRNPLMTLDVTLNPSGAYQSNVGTNWEKFYANKRSSATRRRDRTKAKRLGEMGDVRFVTPQVADTPTTLDALIHQKRRAFARMGVPDIFAPSGHIAFFQAIAANRDLCHVSRLDVGATQAAINLGLTFRGCYYHILASYDDGEVSRFGPGAAHLRELLRYAAEHGMPRFDFTIGDEPYKREWCDVVQTLHDHVSAATWRGWPLTVTSSAWRRTKRTIKTTGFLWSATQRLRAAIGSARNTTPAKSDG